MSNISNKFKKRKKAIELIKSINENPSGYLLIHYSCESFIDTPNGNTPRVTSIAVRYFDSAQTKSFSIHKMAELNNISTKDIYNHYDKLEREMLHSFFDFVKNHLSYKWIHINMRDINYGFEAIEHRYSVLGGEPITINDNLKIDFARILIDKYGTTYSSHPRFETLYKRNKLTMLNFLTGKEEALAFQNREYVKLHLSTLRKIDNLHNIVIRDYDGNLKTDFSFIKFYGYSPQGIFYLIQESWFFALLSVIAVIIISFIIGKLF
ncbi:hypothetical protein EFY79_16810 [Hanamia caeni]|jgi:hypothetical protein|uniref:Uncharacterized protein n=1 Tax=Hanamia caeni TaxID=2294116 RepID=A0A3M9N838_9BACT|nr:hypothetical protein [Hanamia caeni]RNI33970.1 hypothetical protein EFY79_16810 [Hanamia caeni]